jgi:hypothetical protein
MVRDLYPVAFFVLHIAMLVSLIPINASAHIVELVHHRASFASDQLAIHVFDGFQESSFSFIVYVGHPHYADFLLWLAPASNPRLSVVLTHWPFKSGDFTSSRQEQSSRADNFLIPLGGRQNVTQHTPG